MKNVGKEFEDSIKRSIPSHILLYRIPDAAQSFSGGNLRFSRKNPFDFIMWDSQYRILYALEMKTVSGKSVSFERSLDEHGDIHVHQIEGLKEWSNTTALPVGSLSNSEELKRLYLSKYMILKELWMRFKRKALRLRIWMIIKFGI